MIIKGYARRPERKWPLVLLITAGIISVFALLVALAPTGDQEMTPTTIAQVSSTTVAPSTTSSTIIIQKEVHEKEVHESVVSEARGTGIVFTSKIDEANRPTDNLSSISLREYQRIYCYSKIEGDAPGVIRHVWIAPDGEVAADIKLNLIRRSADTWSYVSLYGVKTGNWQLQVKDDKGAVLASKTLYVGP